MLTILTLCISHGISCLLFASLCFSPFDLRVRLIRLQASVLVQKFFTKRAMYFCASSCNCGHTAIRRVFVAWSTSRDAARIQPPTPIVSRCAMASAAASQCKRWLALIPRGGGFLRWISARDGFETGPIALCAAGARGISDLLYLCAPLKKNQVNGLSLQVRFESSTTLVKSACRENFSRENGATKMVYVPKIWKPSQDFLSLLQVLCLCCQSNICNDGTASK